MYRWTVLFASVLMLGLLAMGCSGGNAPTAPGTTPELAGAGAPQVQTHLWGYWDLYFDFENKTVEAVPNHSAEFAANVVSFLNSQGGLAFVINGTPADPGGKFVDVDIDVKLTHPLSGLTMYNGYDVRGIFLGDGTKTSKYDTKLKYAKSDSEQFMLDDPAHDDGGGADGYTRWWNPKEFTSPGLLGYLKGNAATPGYSPTATLNPYKYFADGLGADEDVWDFLNTTDKHGVFMSGKTNTRNYYIRFPQPTPGVKYGYAVVATWKGEAPGDHPANATEAVGIDVVIDPDLYFVDSGNKGGDFDADISVFDWGTDTYQLHIDTELSASVYNATPDDMIPIGGTDTYSTYHIEFTPNYITFNSETKGRDAEYWVVVEYPDADYKYPEAPAPPAPTANLAAFFRFNDLFIASVPYHADPTCDLQTDPMPYSGPGTVDFDITGSTYFEGSVFESAEWDFDGDGVFNEVPDDDYTGTPEQPTHAYLDDWVGTVSVIIHDDMGGEATCSVDIDVTILWGEYFDAAPADWTYAYYQYWSGCSNGTVAWSSYAPFGPSASGNVRYPAIGNSDSGGSLQTVVTIPFFVPTGASEVCLRVYMCEGFGGSWSGYMNSNWKMVESSTPGLSPFVSGPSAPLPGGGAYLQNSVAHGSAGWGQYAPNPCYTGPLMGQPGWTGNHGGGAFPAELSNYMDLIIPAQFYGKTVKAAWQWHTDWCGYTGAGTGFAIDDMQLFTY